MAFEFRPQFTLYHPEMDGFLFWAMKRDANNEEMVLFRWANEKHEGFRHMLVTMHDMHDIETDQIRLNFLVSAMLGYLQKFGYYDGAILVPIERKESTTGNDNTIMKDLNFLKVIRVA